MSKALIGSQVIDIDLFVFDKDGLLFDNTVFWSALAISRGKECEKRFSKKTALEWLNFMGVRSYDDGEDFFINQIDINGIFATASPKEEITATAGFLTQKEKKDWVTARQISEEIFVQADINLDLYKAISPHKGFPFIFSRLREVGIPYGIATSDTYERAWSSVQMFDDPSKLSFIITPKDVENGKPNPDMLNFIQKKANIPMNKIAMVGDSFVDMEMAKRAGAIGIGIPQDDTALKSMHSCATVIIENLNEISFMS